MRAFRLIDGEDFTYFFLLTVIAVEWIDRAKPADGSEYINEGVHIIKMQWGKVFYLHAYLDTQIAAELCERLAKKGLPEASLKPIDD